MKVGVVGASGYTGELLLRLLARHPHVELAVVTSRQLAGTPVEKAIPTLRDLLSGLVFHTSDPRGLAAMTDIDLFFLALPHGASAAFARPLLETGKKVIDLSADFRLNSPARYEEFYGQPHPDKDLLASSIYVIPEITDRAWKNASLLASPGCYPTSILLPLIPLLREGIISNRGIVICSFSGVSGAGKKATEFFSYCERSESAVAYGLPKHRHLGEIEEQLSQAAETPPSVQFIPHLAPMKRGIISTITAATAGQSSLEALYATWEKVYRNAPFISLLPSGTFPDSAHLVSSNRIEMAAVHDLRTGNFIITTAIDNLMKGASGQAVQIMNLWNNFPEEAGLL